jgi:hypothetical protein
MRKRRRFRGPERPTGFYKAYLEKLISDCHAKGKPAPDVVDDDDYWNRRRENELLRDQPLKKAA